MWNIPDSSFLYVPWYLELPVEVQEYVIHGLLYAGTSMIREAVTNFPLKYPSLIEMSIPSRISEAASVSEAVLDD